MRKRAETSRPICSRPPLSTNHLEGGRRGATLQRRTAFGTSVKFDRRFPAFVAAILSELNDREPNADDNRYAFKYLENDLDHYAK
jgi:hypothetical protein